MIYQIWSAFNFLNFFLSEKIENSKKRTILKNDGHYHGLDRVKLLKY